jgi:predicted NBD/HSP70 family sugar kinase
VPQHPHAPRRSLGSAGELFDIVRSLGSTTRAELTAMTGLARSTVSQRVDALVAAGLLVEDGEGPSTGGRPPVRLAFNASAGAVLAADMGATRARLAVTDLEAVPLATLTEDVDIAAGPTAVLGWVVEAFDRLLAERGLDRGDVVGIGMGLPGPVEFTAGRVVSPPIMPGWDGVVVPELLRRDFPVPVLVDNDVNIMTVGEHWSSYRDDVDDLLMVKVGTGIGAGIIADGRIQRGADGAAGDLGHVQVADRTELCRCGNFGCVEAVAGGAALAAELRELGFAQVRTAEDVVALVASGDSTANRAVREAGRRLGEVLAAAVNLLNPSVIVLGGTIARSGDQLLAGVREVVYQRSLPLATRHLQIVRSRLDDRAGVVGAAVTAIEEVLDAQAIDRTLVAAQGAPS